MLGVCLLVGDRLLGLTDGWRRHLAPRDSVLLLSALRGSLPAATSRDLPVFLPSMQAEGQTAVSEGRARVILIVWCRLRYAISRFS